ncbi:hypothetical protein [Rhizobium nepotum]|uniref:hypothetical protein n=1 Tax=Rhizobium nepotum TaxID=1035271 RepID=UPI003CF338E3
MPRFSQTSQSTDEVEQIAGVPRQSVTRSICYGVLTEDHAFAGRVETTAFTVFEGAVAARRREVTAAPNPHAARSGGVPRTPRLEAMKLISKPKKKRNFELKIPSAFYLGTQINLNRFNATGETEIDCMA